MKNGLIALLCVLGLIFWGISSVNAQSLVQWTLLTDGSIAGAAPQNQGGNWIVLPGSGGTDGCNFSTQKNCAAGGVPNEGSFSFSAIEYYKAPGDNSTWHSCLDLSGSQYSGAPCVCAEPAGQPCTGDAQCDSGGSCAGAGDCCPGPLWTCEECTDDPAGPDSFSYFGIDGTLGPAPNMDTCGKYGTQDQTQTLRYHVATSESIAGSGGACIKLKSPATGPYLATPCGVGQITSGNLDVDIYVGGCSLKGTTIDNIQYTGAVLAVTDPAPSAVCGYTSGASGQVKEILDLAAGKGGNFVMILCGDTTVPGDSQTACLRNAESYFVTVAYTEALDITCPDDACP